MEPLARKAGTENPSGETTPLKKALIGWKDEHESTWPYDNRVNLSGEGYDLADRLITG